MNIGVPYSKLTEKLDIITTDEGEAISLGCGYYLSTKQKPSIYMCSNGFMNALDAITSLVIPYKIPLKLYIQIGRKEEWHIISSKLTTLIVDKLELYNIGCEVNFIF